MGEKTLSKIRKSEQRPEEDEEVETTKSKIMAEPEPDEPEIMAEPDEPKKRGRPKKIMEEEKPKKMIMRKGMKTETKPTVEVVSEERRGRKSKLNDSMLDEIKEKYIKKPNASKLAKEYGISTPTMTNFLNKHNLSRKSIA